MNQPGGSADRVPTGALTTESALAQLADIVEELVGRRIDPDENFFEAGLTSLTVTRLHALVCRRLNVQLPETGLFSHPHLRGAAELVMAAGATGPAAAVAERSWPAANARRDVRAKLRQQPERP